MGMEYMLIPILAALIDWGMPLPAEFIEERTQVCEERGLHAKLLWTNDYWPGISKFPVENYVRGIRCVEPPQLDQPIEIEDPIEVSPVEKAEQIVAELF